MLYFLAKRKRKRIVNLCVQAFVEAKKIAPSFSGDQICREIMPSLLIQIGIHKSVAEGYVHDVFIDKILDLETMCKHVLSSAMPSDFGIRLATSKGIDKSEEVCGEILKEVKIAMKRNSLSE